MLSKEEILNQYRDDSKTPFLKGVWFSIADAKEAMDEYAKQEAIGFAAWIDGKGYECVLHTDENVKMWCPYGDGNPITTDDLYNLYLESKTK